MLRTPLANAIVRYTISATYPPMWITPSNSSAPIYAPTLTPFFNIPELPEKPKNPVTSPPIQTLIFDDPAEDLQV